MTYGEIFRLVKIMRILTLCITVLVFDSAWSQNNLPVPCEKASPRVGALIQNAIETFDDNEPVQSIRILKNILETAEPGEMNGLCKAWVYQWLALSYDDLDSLETARQYLIRSLEQDPEIWREYADSRLPSRLRKNYQERWNAIETQFAKKRRSWRVAVGPIIRADLSNRYGVVTGIGTTFVSLTDTINGFAKTSGFAKTDNNFEVNLFRDLLLYVRLQWMRKTIERVTAGAYGEFSLSFPLKRDDWKKPDKAVSFGPSLSYAWQSGWEFGGTFEAARLVIGSGKTRISQTISNQESKLFFSYANFELYLRKWF